MTPSTRDALLAQVRALAPEVEAAREHAEAQSDLPGSLVLSMKAAGLFRMTMPRARGGLECDPLTQLEVIEELSRLDGSVGWFAMIGSDSGYYSAYLDPAVAEELYEDVDAVTAGFVHAAGSGTVVPGGYLVSGRWPFGSGCRHADWLASGFVVAAGGGDRSHEAARPEWRVAMLPPSRCRVRSTWDAMGLRASGSHEYEASAVFVPAEHTFSFSGPIHLDGALYRFPGMFLANAAAVPLGVAQAAVDLLLRTAATKSGGPHGAPLREEPRVQVAVAEAEATLGSARSYVHDCVGDLWEALQRGDGVSLRHRALVRLSAAHAFRAARTAVLGAIDTLGTSGIMTASPLQRQLRDLMTLNQHVLAQTRMVECTGQLLLGVDPEAPLV